MYDDVVMDVIGKDILNNMPMILGLSLVIIVAIMIIKKKTDHTGPSGPFLSFWL